MRTPKHRLLIFVVGIVGAMALVYALASPTPTIGTIAYHRQKLAQLRDSAPWKWGPSEQCLNSAGRPIPGNAMAYANPKTWFWFLLGRPTIKSHVEEAENHQQALIRLGYFERHELIFSHRTADARLWNQFCSAVSNSPLAESNYLLHLDDSRPSVIRVTTCKVDIPVFERIIRQLDAQTNK